MIFNIWKLVRPSSALLLITTFLALSYCPLRRTIQSLIKGTYGTEQAGAGWQPVSVICEGVIDRSLTKFMLSQADPRLSVAVYAAIVLSLFYSSPQLARSGKGSFVWRKCLIVYLHSVPIYLTNRMLLI